MPQDRDHRRHPSGRSYSPVPTKHKRSWQTSVTSSDHSHSRKYTASPPRGHGKKFKPAPKFVSKTDFAKHRSRSPRNKKSQRSRSPGSDDGYSAYQPSQSKPSPPPDRSRPSHSRLSPPPDRRRPSQSRLSPPPDRSRPSQSRLSPPTDRSRPTQSRLSQPPDRCRPSHSRLSPPPDRSRPSQSRAARSRSKDRSGSRRQWSPSPPPQNRQNRDKQFAWKEDRDGHYSRTKKEHVSSPPPPAIKRPRSRSPHRHHSPEPRSSSTKAVPSDKEKRLGDHSGQHKFRDDSFPQMTVKSTERKRPRQTLHHRFTLDDQEGFYLEENVTIAILRNPSAEPSDETTVKRVFDPALFKMVHKKTEGRRPIFDREEIKVWRHDENLADDPDFERRLVRVKSTGKQKTASRGMSPNIIRKAIGHASSPSVGRGPMIKLDPKPDPRYESKYRRQMEKEETLGWRTDSSRDNAEDGDVSSKKKRKDESYRSREDERRVEQGSRDTYDLRQALDRRRSDRDDVGSFKVKVVREEDEPSMRSWDADSRRDSSPDKGRSVVMGYGRRDTGYKEDRRGAGRGRGQRQGWRGRFNNQDWNQDRREQRQDSYSRDDGRSTDWRNKNYSTSPQRRGRGGGFRTRGSGRDRDYDTYHQEDPASPTDINAFADNYKYMGHDDRDVSPKMFRGRGRGRFQSRSFGSTGFRGNTRGFRFGRATGYRGRGFGNRSPGDRRSMERDRERSVDKEWKHDMYDSLQAEEEEEPHSTTVGT